MQLTEHASAGKPPLVPQQVVFTMPKGVAPGTRLQMIPVGQVMKRGI